jgi:hypothetical protein
MKFLVTPLRRHGKRIPRADRLPPYFGDLVVVQAAYQDGTHRRQAFIERRLMNASNVETLLGPLVDPALIASGTLGLLFKGVSPENGGEMVQEWWVRIEQ